MSTTLISAIQDINALVLHFTPLLKNLGEEEFFEFCMLNKVWNALTEDEQERFPRLCPDFVVELRSRTDSLRFLQEKMQEYIANGAQLGWLIDPREKKVYVYRPQAAVECLDNPQTISGDAILN